MLQYENSEYHCDFTFFFSGVNEQIFVIAMKFDVVLVANFTRLFFSFSLGGLKLGHHK